MRGSIERRGESSFRLIVSGGLDGTGKQKKLTRSLKVDESLSESEKQKAADEALALFIADIKRGNSAQSKGMTVSDLWEYWLENYAESNLQETTLEYYKQMWPRIKAALGHLRLDRIEPKHIQQFMRNLAEPGIKVVQRKKGDTTAKPPAKLSAITIRKYHAVLSGMFTKAVKWRFMDYNPCDHTEAPRAKQKPKQIYDLETAGRFLEALEGEEVRHRVMCLLALTAGLRREEIFGLRWRDIDGNIISIRQARVVAGTKIITKEPKTASSRRSVSIPDELAALLKKHSAKEAERRLKLGTAWKGKAKAIDDLIFTSWDGSDLHPQSMNNFLRRFCDANNLPRIQPHAFRHMAGTFLITSGVDYRTVSGKMGHSRASVTMNTYAHLLKSAEQETANTMTNILATCRQQAKEAEENKKAQAK
jgi:integrase